MKYKEILENAKSEPGLTETLSFKIKERDKRVFLAECMRKELAAGRVMRMLVNQFVKEVQ